MEKKFEVGSLSREQVESTCQTLESIKHIDENGREYWNAHELSKALGYSEYYKFKKAIEEAEIQMTNSGDNVENNLRRVAEVISNKNKGGTITTREVEGYQVSRKGAYAITLEADPRKPEVAVAHRYMIETTRKGEVAEHVFNTMKDKEYIDARDNLRIANRQFSETLLQHDVKEEELGIVHDAGDRGMFGKSTRQLKEEHNIPDNRPTADFLGAEMAVAKTFAQNNTRRTIENQNVNGVHECSNIAFEENQKVADLVRTAYRQEPEVLITGEDVKKVERKYKSLTKKQLKAIEQEF